MGTYLTSVIRTAVPAAVGAALSWLALRGVDVPASYRGVVTAAAAAILMAGYYAAVRALERRWPRLGVLLGVPTAPIYPAPPAAVSSGSVPKSPPAV